MFRTRTAKLFVIVLAFQVGALLAWRAPAQAQIAACGEMVMPVAQLRTVGRGYSGYHGGIDLMAPHGSPVLAAAAGTVVYAARYYAYGNIIDIVHADGSITRYAHLSRYAAGIRPGTAVAAGQVIGAVGTTGNAHGAHLHFEVRYGGRPVDPKPFIQLADCRGFVPSAPLRATSNSIASPVSVFVEGRPGGIFE